MNDTKYKLYHNIYNLKDIIIINLMVLIKVILKVRLVSMMYNIILNQKNCIIHINFNWMHFQEHFYEINLYVKHMHKMQYLNRNLSNYFYMTKHSQVII